MPSVLEAAVAIAIGLFLLCGAADGRARGTAPERTPPAEDRHTQQGISGREAVLEDFSDIVTIADLWLNDFSGEVAMTNRGGGRGGVALVPGRRGWSLRFRWDHGRRPSNSAFSGLSYSLFGRSSARVTFDGRRPETLSFPEHSLDLDRIDGILREKGPARRFTRFCASVTYRSSRPLVLRLELRDVSGRGRFERLRLRTSARQQDVCWEFRRRGEFAAIGKKDLDLHRAKVLSLGVEHLAERSANPEAGSLDLHRLWFDMNRRELEPRSGGELLGLLERRACQYFVDWSSRKAASFGIPQDRSTTPDLLTVGGIGFALPGYAACVERGWIRRSEAVRRVLSVLRVLGTRSAFGPEPARRVGHRGWFYHFLGVDGRRKLNLDDPRSTVELSTIDTALALMGVLAAQSYFVRDNRAENEIQALAQQIYDNVDWRFMLRPDSQQFYLGWKPREGDHTDPAYGIADASGQGAYSGTAGRPLTLDYYTDEAFIVTLLAAGAKTNPVPTSSHCAWRRVRDGGGLIRSYPGALFTYQFLRAFIDTDPRLLRLPACPGGDRVDWRENTRKAILRAISYASDASPRLGTYGPNAWGISAAEGPDDVYRAYGIPPLAVDESPDQDGTVTYYAMASAASYGADLQSRSIQALRRAWRRGHWHPRFGLPDAFHDDIRHVKASRAGGILRERGPWVNRALFAIDQGPMLLHLENARSRLVWRLLASNPNIARALDRLRGPHEILLEAEAGRGNGTTMTRSAASGSQTVWLHAGESRVLDFRLEGERRCGAAVRYSNDNFGPLEMVDVNLDDTRIGQFTAEDTGDGGVGWNVFRSSGEFPTAALRSGPHTVSVSVAGGDGFGVEVDAVKLVCGS